MVEDLGKEMIEKVMSCANPQMLKFIKNEDILSILDQTKIGFLTDVSHLPIQEEKELKEECKESTNWTEGSVVIAKWSEDR